MRRGLSADLLVAPVPTASPRLSGNRLQTGTYSSQPKSGIGDLQAAFRGGRQGNSLRSAIELCLVKRSVLDEYGSGAGEHALLGQPPGGISCMVADGFP